MRVIGNQRQPQQTTLRRRLAGGRALTRLYRQIGALRRSVARAASLLALPLALVACTAPTHYAGIDLRPENRNASGVSPEVQALAAHAQRGDKQAQLDLGIRYEEGNGLPADPKRARKLYRLAAATTGGLIYVYQTPVKKGGRGGVVPVNLGPTVRGLAEAKVRSTAMKPLVRKKASQKDSRCKDILRREIKPLIHIDNDVGMITYAKYLLIKLPRPDGRISLILSNIRADVVRHNIKDHVHQTLAYIEDEKCWKEQWHRGSTGYFECYDISQTDGDRPHLLVDSYTGRMLSALANGVTLGQSDTLFRSSNNSVENIIDDQMNDISAPAFSRDWYKCQHCDTHSNKQYKYQQFKTINFSRIIGATAIIFRGEKTVVSIVYDNQGVPALISC